MGIDLEGLIKRGQGALAACDWTLAQECFEQAAARDETPEALDGLGQARYWQGDYPRALSLRERAYAGYHRRGDHRAAALVAIQLAMLHGLINGDGGVVNGWVGHAQRNLEHCGDGPERGWVELFLACTTESPEERERRARVAADLGRTFDHPGLEFDALAYVGKALVEQGAVAEGMALIDQAVAAVSSGLVDDVWAAGEIYCALFHTCEMALDARRARAWLDAVGHYVDRTGELPVSAICRMHFGGLLTAAGRWDEAERELLAALEIYDGTYRGSRFEPLLRLADLRVRQGRLEEAEQLLAGSGEQALAIEPRARLHLARGEPLLAEIALEGQLARRGRGLVSAPTLALLVDAKLAADKLEEAGACADELGRLASATGHAPVRGLAACARAQVAAATGADAEPRFEEAVAAFVEADLPRDAATARLALARLLSATDREAARAEARAALAVFDEIGSGRQADEAAELLRALGDRSRSRTRRSAPLSARETEVLALLAQGRSNADIAERLFISPRTAEHHVSSILAKLGLRNRTEAAAHALRHGLVER